MDKILQGWKEFVIMIEIYSIRKHFMENIHLTTETREQILRHVSERERKAKVQL